MVLTNHAEEKAEEFIKRIERMFNSSDSLICSIDSSVKKPNVISPSTIGQRDAWITITLYNVVKADDALSARKWIRLGEIGADVSMSNGDKWNDYKPTIEITKRFDS